MQVQILLYNLNLKNTHYRIKNITTAVAVNTHALIDAPIKPDNNVDGNSKNQKIKI